MDPTALLFLGLLALGLVGLVQMRPALALAYLCGGFVLLTLLALATALGGIGEAEFGLFSVLVIGFPALLGFKAKAAPLRKKQPSQNQEQSPLESPDD